MRPILLAAALACGGSAGAQTAPMPPHWTVEEEPEDEGAEPRAPLRGIFGRGVSDPRPQRARDWTAAGNAPVCRGSEAEQDAWLERQGEYLSEFWFYGTRSQAVVFLRSVVLPSPAGCAEPPSFSYRIERGFIADGFFHELQMEPDGSTRTHESRRIGSRDPDHSGGFGPFYAMATRDGSPRQGITENRRIAGLSARCWINAFGGYMSGESCVSISGPSRGLPLAMGTQTDTGPMYWTEFTEVMPEAALDPRLFELHRFWRAPR